MKNSIIKTKAAIIILACLLSATKTEAQYDAMFTQYMFNEMFINPAYAGSKEAMSATMLHRQQWVNFPGRPVTTSFSLHGPLMDNKMGVGLSVLNERVGILNRTLVYGSYAYRVQVHQGGTLSMGLMGGIDNQLNKFSQIKVTDDPGARSDPQFSQNSPSILAPNFGVGLFYKNKNFYGGFSIPRLVDNHLKFSSGGAAVKTTKLDPSKFTYYITAGYLFRLNEDLKLRTNAMIKAVQNAPAQIDLGANMLIKELIWAGLSYRSKSSMSVILGIQANKQLLVSYSFDYGVNQIQKYSQGSHEIVLNYLFSFTGRKIITPRYF